MIVKLVLKSLQHEKTRFATAALGVAAATVELTEFAARTLHGRIRVTTDEGEDLNVAV